MSIRNKKHQITTHRNKCPKIDIYTTVSKINFKEKEQLFCYY